MSASKARGSFPPDRHFAQKSRIVSYLRSHGTRREWPGNVLIRSIPGRTHTLPHLSNLPISVRCCIRTSGCDDNDCMVLVLVFPRCDARCNTLRKAHQAPCPGTSGLLGCPAPLQNVIHLFGRTCRRAPISGVLSDPSTALKFFNSFIFPSPHSWSPTATLAIS